MNEQLWYTGKTDINGRVIVFVKTLSEDDGPAYNWGSQLEFKFNASGPNYFPKKQLETFVINKTEGKTEVVERNFRLTPDTINVKVKAASIVDGRPLSGAVVLLTISSSSYSQQVATDGFGNAAFRIPNSLGGAIPIRAGYRVSMAGYLTLSDTLPVNKLVPDLVKLKLKPAKIKITLVAVNQKTKAKINNLKIDLTVGETLSQNHLTDSQGRCSKEIDTTDFPIEIKVDARKEHYRPSTLTININSYTPAAKTIEIEPIEKTKLVFETHTMLDNSKLAGAGITFYVAGREESHALVSNNWGRAEIFVFSTLSGAMDILYNASKTDFLPIAHTKSIASYSTQQAIRIYLKPAKIQLNFKVVNIRDGGAIVNNDLKIKVGSEERSFSTDSNGETVAGIPTEGTAFPISVFYTIERTNFLSESSSLDLSSYNPVRKVIQLKPHQITIVFKTFDAESNEILSGIEIKYSVMGGVEKTVKTSSGEKSVAIPTTDFPIRITYSTVEKANFESVSDIYEVNQYSPTNIHIRVSPKPKINFKFFTKNYNNAYLAGVSIRMEVSSSFPAQILNIVSNSGGRGEGTVIANAFPLTVSFTATKNEFLDGEGSFTLSRYAAQKETTITLNPDKIHLTFKSIKIVDGSSLSNTRIQFQFGSENKVVTTSSNGKAVASIPTAEKNLPIRVTYTAEKANFITESNTLDLRSYQAEEEVFEMKPQKITLVFKTFNNENGVVLSGVKIKYTIGGVEKTVETTSGQKSVKISTSSFPIRMTYSTEKTDFKPLTRSIDITRYNPPDIHIRLTPQRKIKFIFSTKNYNNANLGSAQVELRVTASNVPAHSSTLTTDRSSGRGEKLVVANAFPMTVSFTVTKNGFLTHSDRFSVWSYTAEKATIIKLTPNQGPIKYTHKTQHLLLSDLTSTSSEECILRT